MNMKFAAPTNELFNKPRNPKFSDGERTLIDIIRSLPVQSQMEIVWYVKKQEESNSCTSSPKKVSSKQTGNAVVIDFNKVREGALHE